MTTPADSTSTAGAAGPTVSVVIPARNAELTLRAQLEALAAQSYTGPWEVIVVDNGSSDATAAVAASYAGRLPIHVEPAGERPGAAYARNRGMARARGSQVLFCDADDVVDERWVECMSAALDEFDLVEGVTEDGALNAPARRRASRREQGLVRPLGYLPYAISANMGVRSEAARHVGGWNESYPGGSSEDADFSWRLQLAGYRVGKAQDASIQYRYRIGRRANLRQYRNYGASRPLLYKRFRPYGLSRTSARAFVAQYAWLLLHLPDAWGSVAARENYARRLGWVVGKAQGTLRYRVWFP